MNMNAIAFFAGLKNPGIQGFVPVLNNMSTGIDGFKAAYFF